MSSLLLVRIGEPPPEIYVRLASYLSRALDRPCSALETALDPSPAYDSDRGQYDSRWLLRELEGVAARREAHVLGVADVDLYSAMFTFVFGEARLGGQAGLFSIHRLRPTLYGLPDDPELIMARARREALHEVGHLYGLTHCRNPECVMRFSGAAEEVDLKSDRFCEACTARVRPDATGPPP